MRVGGDPARDDDWEIGIAVDRHTEFFRHRLHAQRGVAGGERGAREFPARLLQMMQQVDRRGLQPREREVERLARERRGREFHCRIAPRLARFVFGKRWGLGPGRKSESLRREFVEGGARGIFQTDQPSDLVERLSDRVVAGRADGLPVGTGLHVIDRGVSAGEGERDEGRLRGLPRPREVGGGDMPPDMIHADERDTVRYGEPLREVDRDEQRPDQPRMVGHGDKPDVGKLDPRRSERLPRDAGDDLDVRAARDLGDHAPVEPMHRDLRRDDIRADEQFPVDLLQNGGGGLVAGGFKAKYEHFT